jgi:hypothetical protein
MGKRDEYVEELGLLLQEEHREGALKAFLSANSNLPGPRGNLELAWAYGDLVAAIDVDAALWRALGGWLRLSEREAPTGDPREFLTFCAIQALGAAYARASTQRKNLIIRKLQRAASDGRWRIREAVAMALQRIAEQDFAAVAYVLEDWVGAASLVEKRAIVATLAHPPLLTGPDRTSFARRITDVILRDIVEVDRAARRTEAFRVLKKGLQYAISVFVAAEPEEGFDFVRRWASVEDADVRSILRANLRKARLAKRHPTQVAECMELVR